MCYKEFMMLHTHAQPAGLLFFTTLTVPTSLQGHSMLSGAVNTPILNTCCPPLCCWVSTPGLPGCGNPNPSTRLNSCRHSLELALGSVPAMTMCGGKLPKKCKLHRALLSCSAEGVPRCKVIILPLGGEASKDASLSMFFL